jgi:malate synthase
LQAWLEGNGAVAINNLMEDAATAEISRSQIWQWLHHGRVGAADVERVTEEELAKLGPGYEDARAIFERIATQPDYVEFLTLPAYDRLVAAEPAASVG